MKKEMGKRPREVGSGERRKLEKKVRLAGERSPGVERVGASLRSSPSRKEKARMLEVREGFSQLEEAATVAEEQRMEEGLEGPAEAPYPPVVEIVDSPEEAPSARLAASFPEDTPTSGAAEVGTPGVEEDEYIDVSDADSDIVPGAGEIKASEGRPQHSVGEASTFEVGETTQAPRDASVEAAKAVPPPDS